MKRQLVLAVSAVVLVLSAGLVLVTDAALAMNWDENLHGDARYTDLAAFDNTAVRDNNTGLVWEKHPGSNFKHTWEAALALCVNKVVGGTAGWRLPSVVELNSVRWAPIPADAQAFLNAFPNFNVGSYWTATLALDKPWAMNFTTFHSTIMTSRLVALHVWCVRGDMNTDQY